jgi:hypothetical protein
VDGWTKLRDPMADLRVDPADPRAPAAVVLCVGFLAVLAIDGIGGNTDLPPAVWVVATAVAVAVGAWWSRPAVASGLAAMAFLALDGFAVERLGVLEWHGPSDVLRLGLLLSIALGVAWERSRRIEDERLDAGRRQLAAERMGGGGPSADAG